MLKLLPFDLPKTGNVPIFYTRRLIKLGYATIDDMFLPVITKLGPWFLSDNRVPAPPRVSFRLDNIKRVIPLSRTIAVIMSESKQKGSVITALSFDQLFNLASKLPQTRFLKPNPFDCRLANLATFHSSHFSKDQPVQSLVHVEPSELDDIILMDEVLRYDASPSTQSEAPSPSPLDQSLQTEFDKLFSEALESKPSPGFIAPKGSKEIAELSQMLRTPSSDDSPIVGER